MEKFVKVDMIIIPFPFSDLSSSKKRPAMVIDCKLIAYFCPKTKG